MYKTSEIVRQQAKSYYHERGGKEKARVRKKANQSRHTEEHFFWMHGITYLDRAAMLIAQGGGCKSCKATEPGSIHGWSIDHDHTKQKGDLGYVRGVLCCGCNSALGHMKEDPVRLRALANYAETYCV